MRGSTLPFLTLRWPVLVVWSVTVTRRFLASLTTQWSVTGHAIQDTRQWSHIKISIQSQWRFVNPHCQAMKNYIDHHWSSSKVSIDFSVCAHLLHNLIGDRLLELLWHRYVKKKRTSPISYWQSSKSMVKIRPWVHERKHLTQEENWDQVLQWSEHLLPTYVSRRAPMSNAEYWDNSIVISDIGKLLSMSVAFYEWMHWLVVDKIIMTPRDLLQGNLKPRLHIYLRHGLTCK